MSSRLPSRNGKFISAYNGVGWFLFEGHSVSRGRNAFKLFSFHFEYGVSFTPSDTITRLEEKQERMPK